MRSRRLARMIGQHKLLILAAMGVLIIGGSVAVYSGASFNYKTANPANTFTAGNLSHSNSKDGAAILTMLKMRPGDTTNGTVIITNNGDIDGSFSLAKGPVTDTAGPGGGHLYSILNLKIEDVTVPATPVTKYDGTLSAFTGVAAGAGATQLGIPWVPGTAKSYKFTVTFPDGGVPSGATVALSNAAGDNVYKSSTCTVEFDWTSVQ